MAASSPTIQSPSFRTTSPSLASPVIIHSPAFSPPPPVPSSSANAIIIPGKSILKKPPPPPPTLLSRITRFLPTTPTTPTSGNGGPNDEEKVKPLKRAHFILPELVTVYPISSMNPPSMPSLKEEKRQVEEREKERRWRVVRSNSLTSLGSPSISRPSTPASTTSGSSAAAPGIGGSGGASVGPMDVKDMKEEELWWSLDKVEGFYRECCEGCEEPVDKAISAAFKNVNPNPPRSVDFSGVQLTYASAGILADVLTIEWGLRKVVFRECDLEELTLKPILHSLLIPNSLQFLSVASNRRLKTPAFRLIGAFVEKSATIQFLDLSQNTLDKKSIEYICAALKPYSAETTKDENGKEILDQGLASLRLDDCQLRPNSLEALSRAVRTSSLRNISLRHNRISGTGCVALALMIRDYPDVIPSGLSIPPSLMSPTPSMSGTPASSVASSPASSIVSLPSVNNGPAPLGHVPPPLNLSSPPATPTMLAPPQSAPARHSGGAHAGAGAGGPPAPPPRHPTTQPLQTTYTPYVPRSRRGAAPPVPSGPAGRGRGQAPNPLSATGQAVPIISTSAQGGITTRHTPGQLQPQQYQQAPHSAAPTTGGFFARDKLEQGLSSGLSRLQGFAASKIQQAREYQGGQTPTPTSTPTGAQPHGLGLGLGHAHTSSVNAAGHTYTPYTPSGAQQQTQSQPQSKYEQGPSAALLDKVRALDALPRVGALKTLDLKGNDLRNGITYIAQVLKRNRTLKVLNLSENKLDVQCLVSIAEALKYNSSLETLDLSKNPCSGPGLEGIQSLRTAFTLNTALKRLFLSSTSLTALGAISLAEFLPESSSLLYLDLTENKLDLAGVMALNEGLKKNWVIRCMDVNVPPGDEKFARCCREILNTCIRNTEEAEKNHRRAATAASNGTASSPTGAPGIAKTDSGRGLGKGVWGMIEASELAKGVKLGETEDDAATVLVRVHACISRMQQTIASSSGGSVTPLLSPLTPSIMTPTIPAPRSSKIAKGQTPAQVVDDLKTTAKGLVTELSNVIQKTEDPSEMEELLDLNDQLTELISELGSLPPPAPAPRTPTMATTTVTVSAPTPGGGRPANLSLQGLGIKFNNSPNVNGAAPNGMPIALGDGEDTPTTPRVDKGKARAEPEPEEHERVLSPTAALIGGDDDESENSGEEEYFPAEEVASPTHRSKNWVEEEGEVFRKGNVLLGPEEMESEFAGEELRKELLEAMVERPPPRSLGDDFNMELQPPLSPTQQEPPEQLGSAPGTPITEVKPSPKPYIKRRSSNSSIMSVLSNHSASGSPVVSAANSPAVGSGEASALGASGIQPSLSRIRPGEPTISEEAQ